MSRILTYLLVCSLLLPCFAFAELDYSSLSDEELIAIQEEASKEIMKRNNIPFVFVSKEFGFHLPVNISSSDDPHIYYLPDFIGKNLASINIINTEIGNNFYYIGPKEHSKSVTNYRSGVWLEFVSIDGDFVDIEDKELLKQYTVVWQSPVPNTAITFSFETDYWGELVEVYDKPAAESVQTGTLYVVK